MSKKQKTYEKLLEDLKKGMVTGLEETYLEHKLSSNQFTNDSLKSIISEIEKNYEVKFKKVLSHFSPNHIQ